MMPMMRNKPMRNEELQSMAHEHPVFPKFTKQSQATFNACPCTPMTRDIFGVSSRKWDESLVTFAIAETKTMLHSRLVVCNRPPYQDIHKTISGTTGHSLGIVSAVILATSTTEVEFIQNAQTGVTLLFWIGLRAAQAYPTSALDPDILEDSLQSNEGKPTPMLNVAKLTISQVHNCGFF